MENDNFVILDELIDSFVNIVAMPKEPRACVHADFYCGVAGFSGVEPPI
jgi:hypothetical protein